ncbi:MAG: hypothetical protein KAQ98_05800 [Bacteriovoracaceae bacterium]|nr:hypothetical protein [Bacteriovoracaceae bacterium]
MVKTIQTIFFVVILFTGQGIQATTNDVINKINNRLEFEFEFQELMLKAAAQKGHAEKIESLVNISEVELEKVVKHYGNQILDIHEKHADWPEGLKKLLFKKINWSDITIVLADMMRLIRAYSRYHGAMSALLFVIGKIMEPAMVFILVQVGLTQFIAPSLTTPYAIIFVAAWESYIKKYVKYKHLGHLFPNKNVYDKFLKFNNDVEKRLNTNFWYGNRSLFKFGSDRNSSYVAVIKNQKFFGRIVNKLRGQQSILDFNSLVNFCGEINSGQAYSWILTKKKKIDLKHKTSMLLLHLLEEDASIMEKLQKKFPTSFIKIPKLTGSAEYKNWCIHMMNADSISKIQDLMREIPSTIFDIEVMDYLWRELFFPRWASKFGISGREYRYLFSEYDNVRKKIINSKSSKQWSHAWTIDFYQYLETVKNKSNTSRPCHEHIIPILMGP